MSLTIFWIALFPTITIFMVASVTHNKFYITLTAIVIALIGVYSGSPQYATTDVVFAGIVWLICITNAEKTPSKPVPSETNIAKSSSADWLVALIAIAMILVAILPSKKEGAVEQAEALPVAPTVAPPEDPKAAAIRERKHALRLLREEKAEEKRKQEARFKANQAFSQDFPEDIYQ